MIAERQLYTIGIKVNNKEQYDKLMEDHSKDGLFGIDFKALFRGYPENYPCLIQYLVDVNPVGLMYATQLHSIIDDGYMVCFEKGDGD